MTRASEATSFFPLRFVTAARWKPLSLGTKAAPGSGPNHLAVGDHLGIGGELGLDHGHAVGGVRKPLEEGVLHDRDDQLAHADEEIDLLPPVLPEDQVVRSPEPGVAEVAALDHLLFHVPDHDAEIPPVPDLGDLHGPGMTRLLVVQGEGLPVLEDHPLEHACLELRLQPHDVPLVIGPGLPILELHEVREDRELDHALFPAVGDTRGPGCEIGIPAPGGLDHELDVDVELQVRQTELVLMGDLVFLLGGRV